MYANRQLDQLGDVRSMKEFENETFDCVIDKGMLDSILVISEGFSVDHTRSRILRRC